MCESDEAANQRTQSLISSEAIEQAVTARALQILLAAATRRMRIIPG
jgi:hypothetical protein